MNTRRKLIEGVSLLAGGVLFAGAALAQVPPPGGDTMMFVMGPVCPDDGGARIPFDAATGKARWHLQSLGLFGRIIRVCSTYDALTSSRPYREAFPPSTAIAMMTTQMKHEFDPHLLATFVKVLAGVQVQAAPTSYTVA